VWWCAICAASKTLALAGGVVSPRRTRRGILSGDDLHLGDGARGHARPHEHVDQADLFCFLGPSNFKIRMWDNRPDSNTFKHVMTLVGGADNPKSVLVPKGVVHAYRNVGEVEGIVINCPNRLYAGDGKREAVDEIRHEDDPDTVFRIEG